MALYVARDADGVVKYAADASPLLWETLATPTSGGGYAAMEDAVLCARACVRAFSDMSNIFVVLSGLIILPKLFIPRFHVYGTTPHNLGLFSNCSARDVQF